MNYDCVGDNDGHVNLPGVGGSDPVLNVPTGNCTITVAPADQLGWSWGAITYPGGQTVEVTTGQLVEAKVTNTITRDTAKLLLVKQVPEPTGSLTPDKWTLKAKNTASPDKNYSEKGDNTDPKTVWAENPIHLVGDTGCGREQLHRRHLEL